MKDIFQLAIGIPGNKKIFFSKRDQDRLLDYAKIYKERFDIDLLAYCLNPECAQFLFFDGTGKRELYAHNLTEAYGYFLQLILGTEVRMKSKLFPMDSMEKYMDAMRYFHRQGTNSFKHYQKYSRYVKDELLSIPLVLNTFYHSHRGGQEDLLKELVSEPSAEYALEFKKAQIFKRDKLSKRRERARDFMDEFLEEYELSEAQLLSNDYLDMKKLLIKKFREETDLSFRDIGHVLGISHTTVIRLHKELE